MTGLVLPFAMRDLGVRSLPDPLLPVEGAPGTALVVLSVGVARLVYGVVLGAVYGRAQNGPATREP